MSKTVVTVMGVGYVGLPLACLAAQKGYFVYGLDIKKENVKKINNGKLPFKDDFIREILPGVVKQGDLKATTNALVLKKSDIVIVCVPTPVDKSYQPDFVPLIEATKTIATNLKKGQLVIIESTINPGVCEEILIPIFKEKNFQEGRDFFLAHAPERVNPGDSHWNVSNLARNVGALSQEGLNRALKFYRSIISAPVNPMKSIKEAEATKTIENAFRDINIAFINEIAKSFDQLEIDVVDVIKGASSKFSFLAHWPGCGVGGHCIPVDPYYLIRKAEAVGFSHDFLKLARQINNSMPFYAVRLLQDELNKIKKSVKGTKVGVLGVAYKANIDDDRESPSYEIIHALKKLGAEVLIYDPFIIKKSNVSSLQDLLKKAEALIVATNHQNFVETLTGELLKEYKIKVVVDGKNCLNKEDIISSGIGYKGIGR